MTSLSFWKHHTGRDMPDTGPFMSIFILIEYDACFAGTASIASSNVRHCNVALDLKLNLRL
jgi:hypothetical protein